MGSLIIFFFSFLIGLSGISLLRRNVLNVLIAIELLFIKY